MTFRPAFWPTLFTIPAILVLLGLGTWQVQRLAWKNDIVARIQERLGQPPVPLPAAPDADALEYRRVTVTGAFLHDREAHLIAASINGNAGYHVIVPLRRADGGHVLVNRGWAPQDRKAAETRRDGQVAGERAVTGVVRKPWRQGWFVPDNDPGRNVWFYGDAAGMARVMGVPDAPALFVDADATPNPGGFPIGGQTRVDIPNNHLSYAVTWYGFAIVLAVVYLFWHRREGRL